MAIAATSKNERSFVCGIKFDDLANDDDVVAAVILVPGFALELRHTAIEQRRAAQAGAVGHAVKWLFAFARKTVGKVLLVFGQYIDGEVAMRPWPLILLSKAGIAAIAQLLREYHDLIRNYRSGANSKWRDPNAKWQEGMIVRHGDLGPWNMVWKSSELVGLIDWDLAEPGYPIEDVAQAAWYCVPMRPLERCIDAGIDFDDQASRLEALCETYGADIDAVTGAIAALQSKEIGRIVELGKTGIEPWKSFMERGDVEEIEAEREWLQSAYRTTAKGGDG